MWRAAASERMKGNRAWNTGLTVADPRIRKSVDLLAEANRNRIWTDEERTANSERLLGIKKSEGMKKALARTKAQQTADAAGMDVDDYLAVNFQQVSLNQCKRVTWWSLAQSTTQLTT